MIRNPNHWFQLLSVMGVLWCQAVPSRADDELGVKVPPGFEVTLYADDELAHDIHSMTIDSFGRVVVSGTGYVKILHDTDGDGVADKATVYADGPQTGAQGLYFIGRDLLCAGDAGLIRYRDRNGDDRADGPPDVFLKIKAGIEHGIHAIRKGPDGWWYVIAGNHAGVNENYISVPTSPVKKPIAGTLLRLSPDLSKGEVFAHGMRNAYDFEFNALGDIFTFDSDDERDISLPWYRENRVFHILPGSHLGWVSNGWKRPDSFFDMPPVVGSFGRGSPTGMVCYQHTQFPPEMRGAMLVLDWTYGRVLALRMKPQGSSWTCDSTDFMTAVGQHGFAPTDAEVGPDGSLFVCVGGRGTRGGVYRIRATGSGSPPWPAASPEELAKRSPAEKLQLCLQAPQPLSSWSRRVWEPLVATLTSEQFLQAVEDRSRPDAERIRAIEILTEKFNGLGGDAVLSLSTDPSAAVRMRAVWSVGRTQSQQPNHRFVEPYLADRSPFVVRAAMEAMIGADAEVFDEMTPTLGPQLAHQDRFVRQTAMRLLTRVTNPTFYKMAEVGFPAGWKAAIPVAGAYALREEKFATYPVDIAMRVLKGNHDPALKLEAVRVLQLALGDLTPAEGLPAVFDGYAPKVDLSAVEQQLDPLRITLSQIYPMGHAELDQELERVIAMVQPPNDVLLGKVLSKVTKESNPVDDIHHLVVAARIPARPGPEQRDIIAEALIHLETKIAARNLQQDSHWGERVTELYQALAERDPHLPITLLEHPDFGLPGHVNYLEALPEDRFDAALAAFSKQVRKNADYPWTSDIIFVLAESSDPADKELIREKFEDFSLRNAVLLAMADHPEEKDRAYLIQGLDSAPLEVVQACAQALALMSPTSDPAENVLLARALRKLGSTGEERLARDQVVEMLTRNLRENHGYALGRDGDPQQAAITTWVEAVKTRFPDEFARQAGQPAESLAQLKQMLDTVNWASGDAARGQQVFHKRSCVQCHGSRTALGPDLTGVAGRFSRDDLFNAIVFPNLDVSPRYQTVQIATKQGQVRTGLIVYEAVDGLVLRDANNRTYRIEATDIEVRRPLSQSLMPSGLLNGVPASDLADLYAYLRSIGTQSTAERPLPGVPE